MSDPFTLQILFVRLAGWHDAPLAPGHLCTVISLGALSVSTYRADGTAFEDDKDDAKLRRFTPPEAEVRALVDALLRLGLPERPPSVDGRVDTSDVWSRNTLDIDINGKSQRIELNLMASGFEGPDAEALRLLFGRLFVMAGVRSGSAWHDLTGADYNPAP